jgi:hypothetical protein
MTLNKPDKNKPVFKIYPHYWKLIEEGKCPFCKKEIIENDFNTLGKKENAIKVWSEEDKQKDYEINCHICGRKFITTTHTANEGICIKCRSIDNGI